MRVVVEYRAPVLCEVDTQTGEVVNVWVAEEELTGGQQCFDGEGDPMAGPDADQARRIADAVEWPAWTFGR